MVRRNDSATRDTQASMKADEIAAPRNILQLREVIGRFFLVHNNLFSMTIAAYSELARVMSQSLRVRPNSLSQISMGYKRRGTEIFVELGAFAFHPGILRM